MNHFAAIQAKLEDYGLDAMLVTSPSNRKYATDFPSSAGMALVTRHEAFFYILFELAGHIIWPIHPYTLCHIVKCFYF